MNKTLSEIQAELKVWTEYNFGQQESIMPIMGMIEELGELTHAHLKELQGIRKSDFLADKKDALADITIYLLNYFNCIDKDIKVIDLIKINNYVIKRMLSNDVGTTEDWIIDLGSLICCVRDNINNYKDLATDIIADICCYCAYYNINFITIVNETWEQVKLRDWKKYPKDGRTE